MQNHLLHKVKGYLGLNARSYDNGTAATASLL